MMKPNNKKRIFFRILTPFAIIALSIFVFIVLFKSKPPTQQKIVTEKIWFVKSQTITLAEHQPILHLIGKVISAEEIHMTSSIDADILKRWVSIGDQVSQGKVLLTLDPSTLKLVQAQRIAEVDELSSLIKQENQRVSTDEKILQKEKSLLNIANNAVTRAQTLAKNAMASSSQLDDAKRASLNQQIAIAQRQANIDNHPMRLLQLQAKLKSAKARLAISNNDLTHTIVVSPVDGIVTKISLDQAEHVNKGGSLVSIYNNQKLELKAFVPEKHIPVISLAIAKGQVFTGSILNQQKNTPISLLRVSGKIESNAAGSYLYFSINANPKQYIPGQTLSLQLNMPKIKNTVSLPSDAIYGVNNIFLIIEDRLKRISVNWLGETIPANATNPPYDIEFLVQSPQLKNGDSVLTSKFANAMQGLKVSTQQATNESKSP